MKFSFSHLIVFVAASVISGVATWFIIQQLAKNTKTTTTPTDPNLADNSFLNNRQPR